LTAHAQDDRPLAECRRFARAAVLAMPQRHARCNSSCAEGLPTEVLAGTEALVEVARVPIVAIR
jgi:hypothetical protein